MKYWVYKDSRILGPFDKDAFAGLPGVDSSTLVCAGDSAAAAEGDWRPVGDIADLSALPLDRGPAWPTNDSPSALSLLDGLQLETSGLIGDDEFPGASADLFEDAGMKRTFADLLSPRRGGDEGELRRAKDRAIELTAQLEILHRRVSELEVGQTSLLQRLAEKETLLRGAPPTAEQASAPPLAPAAAPPPVAAPVQAVAPPAAPAPAPPQALAPVQPPSAPPAPPPLEMIAPPPASIPPPPLEWPSVATEPVFPSFPSRSSAAPAPAPILPAEIPPPAAAPMPSLPSATVAPASGFSPPVPPLPVTLPGAAAPVELTPPAAPAPSPEPPKKAGFERKIFKIVPTVKAFRAVGSGEPGAAPIPPVPGSAAASGATNFDWSAPAEPVAAVTKIQKTPAPETVLPPPVTAPPAPVTAPPIPAPPATLSFGSPAAPAPAFAPLPGFTNPGRSFTSRDSALEPATPAPAPVMGSGDIADAPSTQEALARLAKPAPEPATAAPRPRRNNRTFLIAGGALLVAMIVVVALFLRHPKDLKQMTDLDDGRARVGAEPVDDQARLPLVKPKMSTPPADVNAPAASAAPAAPAAEAPQAASQAKLDAAIAAVKDFPLDGDRGSVAELLQFSYAAVPGAGKESWSASETADKTYLVDYRFTPSAPGAAEKTYLFEVDMERGFVIGKNLDAQNMLAGGPRGEEPKPKPKAKAKAKPKRIARRAKPAARAPARPAEDLTPKEVPLLPLPNEGELRPPAEDDGAFTSDTVHSGL